MTDAWMTMIFRHAFFHGDPHPANILHLDDGRLGLVDFGLAGRLTDTDMARLTRLFVDAATENIDALPRRLAELGVRYPRDREDELRGRLEELYYRYYGARLADIDPVEAIREGLALIYGMNLRLPTRFVILDKAIATLGSVAAEVYPEFNVFEVARPYARQLVAERLSPRRLALRARSARLQELGRDRAGGSAAGARRPRTRCATASSSIRISNPGVDDLAHHIDVSVNRIAVALVILGGLVGSSLIGVLAEDGPHLLGLHLLVGRRLRHLGRLRPLAPLGRHEERPPLTHELRAARRRRRPPRQPPPGAPPVPWFHATDSFVTEVCRLRAVFVTDEHGEWRSGDAQGLDGAAHREARAAGHLRSPTRGRRAPRRRGRAAAWGGRAAAPSGRPGGPEPRRSRSSRSGDSPPTDTIRPARLPPRAAPRIGEIGQARPAVARRVVRLDRRARFVS